MKITLRQIEGFLAAAETLSFSRAAEKIGMTQPAFSQMIRELESGLELRLFDRTTRQVNLTIAAKQLHQQLRSGVDEIGKACRNAHAIARLEQGHLSLAVLPSLAFSVVMRALIDFRSIHPGISVHLYEDHNTQVITEIENHVAELAICAHTLASEQLLFEELFIDQLVCVMPKQHRLTKQQQITWSLLEQETIILVSTQSMVNALIRKALEKNANGKKAEYQVINMVTALNMTRAGFGVSFLPLVALAELNMQDLVYRSLINPAPLRRIGLYRHRDHALSPAAEQFYKILLTRISTEGLNISS